MEAFLMEVKRENARVFEIWAYIQDSQVVGINPEPSANRIVMYLAGRWVWWAAANPTKQIPIMSQELLEKVAGGHSRCFVRLP